MLQKYQMLAYIVFEDTQSLQRIPRGGIDHAVESRSQDEGEPYDISLQDVEALLYPVESATTSSATASADKDKVLGFRLTPAGAHTYSVPRGGTEYTRMQTGTTLTQKTSPPQGTASSRPHPVLSWRTSTSGGVFIPKNLWSFRPNNSVPMSFSIPKRSNQTFGCKLL